MITSVKVELRAWQMIASVAPAGDHLKGSIGPVHGIRGGLREQLVSGKMFGPDRSGAGQLHRNDPPVAQRSNVPEWKDTTEDMNGLVVGGEQGKADEFGANDLVEIGA